MSFLWYWPAGGWDFAKWKSAHPWTPIASAQSGRADLLPLAPAGTTRQQWEDRRKQWMDVTNALLGEIRDTKPAEPRWEFLGEPLVRSGTSTHTLQRLRYALTAPKGDNPDDVEWGYAWLLMPHGNAAKRPAVIALHQTVMQGKNETVGLDGRPGDPGGMEFGRELAERGVIVFAPDAIAFGERAADHSNARYRSADQFFAAHPDGSVMRKMAFDVSRAVDVLSRMPHVDPNHIGCIGHSHGGYGTIFAMLCDERLKAGVISCGFNTLRDDPRPQRWWEMTALIPRLGYYAGDVARAPIDYHIWLSMLAPRPLVISAATKDAIFPNPKFLSNVMDEVRGVYRLYGADEKLDTIVFDGAHDFPKASRERAYEMLTAELTPSED